MPRQKSNPWLRYSGMAVQLALTIGVFVALGLWLDERFGSSPWATVGCSLLGVCGGLYLAIKDFV